MRKFYILCLIGLVGVVAGTACAEEITLTTYYPAPYGVYNEMRARRMAIGGNYLDSGSVTVADDNLLVEGNVGIGDTTPDGSLKLDVEGSVGATQYCDQNGNNCSTPPLSGTPLCEVITANSGQAYIRNHTGLVEITFNLSGYQAGAATVSWQFLLNGIPVSTSVIAVNNAVWPSPSYTYFLPATGDFSVNMSWTNLTAYVRQIVIKRY